MRSKNKLILFVVCLILLIVPFVINAEEDSEYQNGDIKCPSNASNCTSDKDKAVVTEQMGNYKVVKTVSKTDVLGKYNVSFHVEGNNNEKTVIEEDAYIIVVFDKSGSLSGSLSQAKDGVKEFAKKFSNNDNYHLAMIVFADRVASSNKFSKSLDTSLIDSGVGSNSHIELALKEANRLFNTIPEDANKYLIVFGDGQYWCQPGWCRSEYATCNSNNKNKGTCNNSTFKGIWYEQQLDEMSKLSKINKYAILYKSTSVNNIRKDYEYIGKITNDYKDARNNTNYKEYFLSIADDIGKHQDNTKKKVNYKLKDYIGDNFNVGTTKTKSFESNANSADFGPFTIKINKSTKDKWNETNSKFVLEVNGKKYTSKVNPLVYWNNQKSLDSCSSSASIIDNQTIDNKYYSINCEQGWNKINGYKVDLFVNNLKSGTTSFNIHNGMGFPVSVNISSNLRCTYEFNQEAFMTDYLNYENKIRQAEREHNDIEVARIQKKLDNMIKDINNNFVNKANNLDDLNNYKTKVENQTVKLVVSNSSISSEVSLVNANNPQSELQCDTSTQNVNVHGIHTYSKRVCTVSTIKKMQLPAICLSMKSGNSESCSNDSKNQLNGGNNFYINKDMKKGYISILIQNASYFGDDFNLDGSKNNKDGNPQCQFTTSTLTPIYRQIELADPFNQSYTNKERAIGHNWLNNDRKYNFVNIIDKNTWSNNFEYRYSMSKVNVENIRKNTSEEGVNSYLGRDCYFNSENKYICSFINTSTGQNGSNDYFTNIEVGD